MIPFKKWTEKPKNKKYIYLESDKHYLVLAYEEGTTFGVKVECQHCPERTAIQLQKVNDHYQISNWTKHVRKCFKSNNLDNQQTLKQVQSKCSSATLIKACKLSDPLSIEYHSGKEGSSDTQTNDSQIFWGAPPLL